MARPSPTNYETDFLFEFLPIYIGPRVHLLEKTAARYAVREAKAYVPLSSSQYITLLQFLLAAMWGAITTHIRSLFSWVLLAATATYRFSTNLVSTLLLNLMLIHVSVLTRVDVFSLINALTHYSTLPRLSPLHLVLNAGNAPNTEKTAQ